ncbi:DMT family transporter [Mesobaculum littorinae]|uniref:DMT family transporter n=1 Tax=Mesobaculum littorinae TaxID=2486419 RepID=A0A438AJ58_9RHOB|nr:DMT family transporter [Mesobaculum littorinae]RVV98722.1 DMT family transporter [Mesobaculum littorinae]
MTSTASPGAVGAPGQPTALNWVSVIVLGVIWGGTFTVMRVALDGYGPITVAAARASLGAVALLALVFAMRRPWPAPAPRTVLYLVVNGLVSVALPFMLLSWGQQFVPSAFAGLSLAAVPLFVLPLAHFFTDDTLSLRQVLGVLIGFSGPIVLIGPGLISAGAEGHVMAQVACFSAAVFYATASIVTRRCPPVDPIVMAAITLCVGAVVLVPAMLAIEGVPHWAGAAPGVAIVALGLLPTAFAVLLRVVTIRSAGPVFMTLVSYQVPIWAMIFGVMFLGEALPWRFFAALLLIIAGLLVSQARALHRLFFG